MKRLRNVIMSMFLSADLYQSKIFILFLDELRSLYIIFLSLDSYKANFVSYERSLFKANLDEF